MIPSVSEILKQVAKTGLLVAGLGLILYAVVMAIAGLSYGHWLVGLVVSAPLCALLGFVVVDALRTGVIPVWLTLAFSREHQPRSYWLHTGLTAAGCLGISILAVWSSIALIDALMQ